MTTPMVYRWRMQDGTLVPYDRLPIEVINAALRGLLRSAYRLALRNKYLDDLSMMLGGSLSDISYEPMQFVDSRFFAMRSVAYSTLNRTQQRWLDDDLQLYVIKLKNDFDKFWQETIIDMEKELPSI